MKHLFEATVGDLILIVDHQYNYEWELFVTELWKEDSVCHSVDIKTREDVIKDFTNEFVEEDCECCKELLRLLTEDTTW